MHLNLKDFICGEDGAVTVDWVILTVGIVGVAIAVMALFSTSVKTFSTQIPAALDAQSVNTGL